ncbi:hypothetical protein ACS0TW_13155, partial [Klebsiella michiganensis]
RAGGESPIVHTIFLFCLVVVMFYLFLPVIHRSRDADRGYGFVCSVARTDAQHRLRDILQHPAAFPRGRRDAPCPGYKCRR